MQLDLGKLGAEELKTLFMAAKAERERRGKKNPANHAPQTWPIPNRAIVAKTKEASTAA